MQPAAIIARRAALASERRRLISSRVCVGRRVCASVFCSGSTARKTCRKRYGRYDSRGRVAGKRMIGERACARSCRDIPIEILRPGSGAPALSGYGPQKGRRCHDRALLSFPCVAQLRRARSGRLVRIGLLHRRRQTPVGGRVGANRSLVARARWAWAMKQFPDTAARLAARTPNGERPVVMHHRWEALLFLHWLVSPAEIQQTLPPGLTVDTFEDQAYLAISPFFMRKVRPVGVPPLPWLSEFQELNVRTYVFDERGVPGIWFYSLDCNQPLAVAGARMLSGLPYFNAEMSATFDGFID